MNGFLIGLEVVDRGTLPESQRQQIVNNIGCLASMAESVSTAAIDCGTEDYAADLSYTACVISSVIQQLSGLVLPAPKIPPLAPQLSTGDHTMSLETVLNIQDSIQGLCGILDVAYEASSMDGVDEGNVKIPHDTLAKLLQSGKALAHQLNADTESLQDYINVEVMGVSSGHS